MKTAIVIKGNYSEITFGYWDSETEEFIPITEANDKFAEKFGISSLFLDALVMLVGDIQDKIGQDLTDIWNRLENG